MIQHYRNFTFLLFAFALSACATLGLPTPQTFNQKVAVAYGTLTQVRETATILLEQKKISAQEAMQVQESAHVARVGIESARRAHQTDPTGADANLAVIRTALQALAAYLATKGG